MCYGPCWLITPSIGWIGDSIYPAPSRRSILRWEVVVLPFILIKKARRFFFYFFSLTRQNETAIRDATINASFSACMVCAEKDSTPQRTEMDYGNKESYDKRDGERD